MGFLPPLSLHRNKIKFTFYELFAKPRIINTFPLNGWVMKRKTNEINSIFKGFVQYRQSFLSTSCCFFLLKNEKYVTNLI